MLKVAFDRRCPVLGEGGQIQLFYASKVDEAI
jgi:hypothetical protein